MFQSLIIVFNLTTSVHHLYLKPTNNAAFQSHQCISNMKQKYGNISRYYSHIHFLRTRKYNVLENSHL